jgi:hypothetical protein
VAGAAIIDSVDFAAFAIDRLMIIGITGKTTSRGIIIYSNLTVAHYFTANGTVRCFIFGATFFDT